MIQSGIPELNYFTHENCSAFNFDSLMQSNLPILHSTFLTNFPNYPITLLPQEFNLNSSSISNSSTSDETDVSDHQVTIIDQRKQRRMISNRESARRSRMRKQKHFDELWSQVNRLRTEKHNLIDKLNRVSESHNEIVKENARLKEESSDLRQLVENLQMSESFSIFTDFEEIPCNTAHLIV